MKTQNEYALERDVEVLRAEVARLRGELAEITKHRDIAVDNSNGWRGRSSAWKARAKSAEAHAQDLREALESVNESLCINRMSELAGGVAKAFTVINDALARTPAQSLAAVQARALREAAAIAMDLEHQLDAPDGATGARSYSHAPDVATSISLAIRAKAERLEKEAGDA